MTKRQDYRTELRNLRDWIPFLLKHSNLPGPRGNLELAHAAADEGTQEQFESFLRFEVSEAPVNSPGEFVAVCGAIGLGRLASEGQTRHLRRLRKLAEDPRWRMREGVAMALQRVGEKKIGFLLREMRQWSRGPWLVQRAAAAGLCEPGLLNNQEIVVKVFDILDCITKNVADANDASRRMDEFRSLRQAMGYCWSVAIAANPSTGEARFDRWLASSDPDIQWILRENLGKKRLERADPKWVAKCRAQLDSKTRKNT